MSEDGKTEVVDITIRHLCLHSEKWFWASQVWATEVLLKQNTGKKKKLEVTTHYYNVEK